MENDLVELNEANYGVIQENSWRIQRVFDVHIEVVDGHGGSWLCKVSPKTTTSQENLVKAKIYIHSLLGDIDSYRTSAINYDARCKTMILQSREDLERETATVILPGDSDTEIKIHGPLDNVIFAKSAIENFIRQQGVVISRDVHNDNSKPYLQYPKSSQKSENVNLPKENINSVTKKKLLCKSSSDHSSLHRRRENENPLGGTELRPLAQQSQHPLFQTYSSYQDSSSDSSSDEEDVILEIQNDPDYQSKIEFALKLGYHEVDLIRALKKLGLDAGQNDLLSELIKQGSSDGDPELADNPLDVPHGPDDMKDDAAEMSEELGSKKKDASDNLRHIIIDGSNIAMSHGNKETFSCHGIKLTVDWFRERGHKDITVFVPQWRKETSRSDSRMKDQAVLNQLEKEKFLVYTPARRIGGKRVVCYDDRYILKLAVETDGIVVSNDNYRDLLDEKEDFKKVIEERLLMYSFVNDRFMPPDDPLGRNGPTLEAFLQKEATHPKSLPPLCPYGSKKCTYGNKCKFYHPERRNLTQKSVTEKLAEQSKQRMMEFRERSTQDTKKPLKKPALGRTKSLNPSEMGRLPEELFTFQSGNTGTQNTGDDDTSVLFNQKLSENLKKMEKDSKEVLQRTPDKKGRRKSKEKESQASPRWNFLPGGVSPSGLSPRGVSPSSLIVPGQDLDYEDDEDKFLCGHLLLAKKLSDEANESSKNKKTEKQMKDKTLLTKSSGISYHFSEIPTAPGSEGIKPKQKLQRPMQKQTLSRQYSLQGKEDPRLQGHTRLKQLNSYGGRTEQSISNAEIDSLRRDFMQGQSQTDHQNMYFGERSNPQQSHADHPNLYGERSNAQQSHADHQNLYGERSNPQLSHQNMYGERSAPQQSMQQHVKKQGLTRMQSEGFTPSVGSEYPYVGIPSHAPIARMQSAPDQYILQHKQVHSTPKMTRQNSSSDTQLNKLDMIDNSSVPGRPGQDVYGDGMYGKGGPGRQTAGPVSYQFVGQPAPHGRPMGNTNQALQQTIPRDVNYQYHQNQMINPHIHQQQLPYGNMNNPNVSFGVSTQSVMGPVYSGIGMNQAMYTPNQSAMRHGQAGHPVGQQGPMVMSGPQGQIGASTLPPGPPHFLDQQTSRIWGNSGQFLPMGSATSFQGNNQSDRCSPVQISPVMPSQQANRVSPVPNMAEPFSPHDPRYELYCNLCKLFNADQVRNVMRQHPEADNPNDICAYLIGAK